MQNPPDTPRPDRLSVSICSEKTGWTSEQHIKIENISTEPTNISEFRVQLGTGQKHKIRDVELEPGAKFLLIANHKNEESNMILESDPPIYIYHTEFYETNLKNNTITITDTNGKIVYTNNC